VRSTLTFGEGLVLSSNGLNTIYLIGLKVLDFSTFGQGLSYPNAEKTAQKNKIRGNDKSGTALNE
jgi:hypothetical protein